MKKSLVVWVIISAACLALFGHCANASNLTRGEILQESTEEINYISAEAGEPEDVTIEILEAYLDEDIPEEIQNAAISYGEMYGICPELLEAIAFAESSYNRNASNGECLGLMQINPKWHSDRMAELGYSEADLYEVWPSMHIAADYLAELFQEYSDPAMVLMVYNGDSRADHFLESGNMSEYAEDILIMAAELERKHGK